MFDLHENGWAKLTRAFRSRKRGVCKARAACDALSTRYGLCKGACALEGGLHVCASRGLNLSGLQWETSGNSVIIGVENSSGCLWNLSDWSQLRSCTPRNPRDAHLFGLAGRRGERLLV